MYREHQGYSSGGYGYNDTSQGSGYGHNYQSYHRSNDSLKGKLEQKYWKTKQKVIEKLKKDQDEFVVAGDAEVDARLEAYRHINLTCSQLMIAVELYQNRIFALSQDENEMGRFLRDQGATDKTKAGKMMIAVGKAQSYAAQQRLSLRVPLVRLYQELETFRFRAVADTSVTVDRMEKCRTDYRAGLLWMAEVSKELDPDINKRLDKFRDVQSQVKENRKKFEKLKADVCQKIDLLSASRCNLLSATLAAYQQSMLKFLEQTSKTYQTVLEQFKGHPSYQFTILKHIIPDNGVVDDDEDLLKSEKRNSKEIEKGEEAQEDKQVSENKNKEKSGGMINGDDDDEKLISFDTSVAEDSDQPESSTVYHNEEDCTVPENNAPSNDEDLLGILDGIGNEPSTRNGLYGEFESADSSKQSRGFEDLLGGLDETARNDLANFEFGREDGAREYGQSRPFDNDDNAAKARSSVDDILFGTAEHNPDLQSKSDMDLLSDALGSASFNETEYLSGPQSGFSKQWNDMFGQQQQQQQQQQPAENIGQSTIMQMESGVDTSTAGGIYMPSFLMEQMRQVDPVAASSGAPANAAAAKEPDNKNKGRSVKPKKGQDMSAWFNLFSDLDPLANPDAIGLSKDAEQERSC